MSVTVVVPTWNRRDPLARLLGLLHAQTCAPAEVLVIDNGSTDGAAEAAEHAGARVIRMGSNAGFARAVNRGIEAARSPWIAIVNNDVEPAPDWLERLLAGAGDAWFATGKILDGADRTRIDGTWDAVSRAGCAWRVGQGRRDSAAFSEPRSIRSAPATAAIFRAELFRRAGLFDETFESYLEDVEFGLRCARLGLAGVYVPDAIAYHLGSATLGRWHPDTVRRIARNQVFLAVRYLPLWRWAWPILVGQALWGVVALRHGTFGAFLRGKWEGIRGARRDAPDARLLDAIRRDEHDMRAIQHAIGGDMYWRLYFLLTSGAI